MSIDWSVLLSVMGAMQGLLLAFFLYFSKKTGLAGNYLSFFTLVFSVGLLEQFISPLKEHPFLFVFPDLLGVSSYLYGPFLYEYIYVSIYSKPSKKYHKHFLLFYYTFSMVIILASLKLLFGFEISLQITYYYEIVAFEILFIQLFFYCYKSLKLLLGVENELSLNLKNWLKYLTISLLSIYLLSYVSTNLMLMGFNFEELLLGIVQLGCVIVVYSFSYHALLQPATINHEDKKLPKYNNSSILEENKEEYLSKIDQLIEQEKLYLDPSLTLSKLADLIGVNRFYISQVINESKDKSFPDYINAYRIERSKALLKNDKTKHYTILAIAYESGFNSKTSFNNAFKKHTGLTPSAYRKMIEEKQQMKEA